MSGTFRLALANRSSSGLGTEIVPDVMASLGVIHKDDAPLVPVWALDGWGSIEFTVPADVADPAVYLTGGGRELHLYRNVGAGEALIWGGHLWEADLQRWPFLRFTGYGWAYTLWEKREVRDDFDFGAGGTGTDVWDITRDLIDYTQGKPNGDLGLTFGSSASHGKARKLVLCAEETPKIGSVISDLADADNGFDWSAEPDKVWRMWHFRGTDRYATVVFDGATNVDDIGFRMDGTTTANDIAGVGEVKECAPIHLNVETSSTSQAIYGLLEDSEHRPDIKWDARIIDDIVKDRLRLRKHPRYHPTFRVPRGLGGPVPFVDYDLGDIVRVKASRGGFGTFDVHARVVSISTRITQTQHEYDEVEVDTVVA